MATKDYSKPLAILLRESTSEVHDKASTRARGLTNGELSKQDYTLYLMMLWHVYDALERALEQHALHLILEPTYNPSLLARAPMLSSDISHFLQDDDWQSNALHKRLLSFGEGYINAYVGRINSIANQEDPSALLAHSYVRYMGDLSGGQSVRHTIAKAYGLDETAGDGISFYAFKELRSANPASMGELKRIKEWFREGINAGGERGGYDVKAAILQEASQAFTLNSSLFDCLDEANDEKTNPSNGTRVSTSFTTRTFPLSQIIAFILAACLSHFILVVGGFTGNAGYQKWVAFQYWMSSLGQSTTD